MNVAFLFPGQGSQTLGMGEDFRRLFPVVAKRLDQTSESLGINLRTVIAKGPPRLLAETRIAQPAIFALSYAIGELLAERGLVPAFVAGHSLGEFTAATFAKSIAFEDALALVIERGRLMHQINESVDGGMLAVTGIESGVLTAILEQVGVGVWIANYNAPSQVVLSGLRPTLRKACELVIERGGRGTWFDVAGPYHTPLLDDASHSFAASLAAIEIRDPDCPLVANTSAALLCDAGSIREELSRQMLGIVNWAGTMSRISGLGIELLVEVGPGRVMKGLALRNDPALRCWTTGTVREFEDACRAMKSQVCVSL